MIPIAIRPDQAIQEVFEFNRKLGQGSQALLNIEEIETGFTPKTAVYQEDKLTLYRYQAPESVEQNPVPVLIVYALVNRPYMADLEDKRSIVQGLLAAGIDVYLLDWGYPDRTDCYLTLDDYLNGYLNHCVDFLRKTHKLEQINLLGICQGGTFSLCYAAMHPHKVQNLITMVTPVDFKTEDNLLSSWVQNLDVDLLVKTTGNVPGELLNWTFLSLKPFRLTGQKYIDMVDFLDDEDKLKNFLRMEKWIFDSPDQAGETFREFIHKFYQENRLVTGGLQIGAHEVNLQSVTMPVLNVYALYDHLVPPSGSRPLKDLVGSKDYSELSFKGGHIGIYVSGRAQKEIPSAIGKWLDQRT